MGGGWSDTVVLPVCPKEASLFLSWGRGCIDDDGARSAQEHSLSTDASCYLQNIYITVTFLLLSQDVYPVWDSPESE